VGFSPACYLPFILIHENRQSGYDLYIGSVFISSTLFANDIAFLACSCFGLQHICMRYGIPWDMKFNPQKTQFACFNGNCPDANSVTFGAVSLCWSAQIKYLGCYFRCKECQLILLHLLADFTAK